MARRAAGPRGAVLPVVVIAGAWDSGQERTVLGGRYSDAVLRAGGLPLIRPPGVSSPAQLAGLLRRADAVLIPGGRDFDTERLGLGPVHPRARLVPAAQQDADVALAGAVLRRGVPVLGICYGMQLLGLVSGGTLHQHLPEDAPGTVAHTGEDGSLVRHDVAVAPGSVTAAALGLGEGGSLRVPSNHHQALVSAPPGWTVTARDADGLIEGIERPGGALAIGVQWHPEHAEPGGPQDGLFAALVAAAAG